MVTVQRVLQQNYRLLKYHAKECCGLNADSDICCATNGKCSARIFLNDGSLREVVNEQSTSLQNKPETQYYWVDTKTNCQPI